MSAAAYQQNASCIRTALRLILSQTRRPVRALFSARSAVSAWALGPLQAHLLVKILSSWINSSLQANRKAHYSKDELADFKSGLSSTVLVQIVKRQPPPCLLLKPCTTCCVALGSRGACLGWLLLQVCSASPTFGEQCAMAHKK